MALQIKTVSGRKDLRAFIEFPNRLYKGVYGFVPKLFPDEISTLAPDKNPAYKFCDVELYLAVRDGSIVGRVAAIINHIANKTWNHDEVRFGWIDFIDDREVSAALVAKVEEFGRAHGMTSITGPLGFTDFDAEGMLIEGFDQLCTLPLIYNFPYYKDHMEALGFGKEVDWLEYRIHIPDALPDKYDRVSSILRERYGLQVRKLTAREVRKDGWGHKVFDLLNESYGPLYNFTQLTPEMIDKYIDTYLALLDPKFVSIVTNESDEVIGVGITMPSIVRACKKCGGKLFPFGWIHLLRSMYLKYEDTLELLLLGVRSDYQKKGVNSLIFQDLLATASKCGFKYAETNAELESNFSMRTLWGDMEYDQHKRRRSWTKPL